MLDCFFAEAEHGSALQKTRAAEHGSALQKARAAEHGSALQKTKAARHGPVLQPYASRLPRRITRCFSIAQSRSLAASRLSWVCLPLASATSSLILFLLQYIAVGTIV